MDLVGNDVDTLRGEIEHLVDHLVRNDVDILYEEKNPLVGFELYKSIQIDGREIGITTRTASNHI
jgi:hypothetical protein